MTRDSTSPRSLSNLLALNRAVGVVLVTVLFFGLGENLWAPFMPAFLKALTRTETARPVGWETLWAVGVYACLRNLFEGFCYVGGGQLTARLGDRGSLILFGILTVLGYTLFLASTNEVVVILAAVLILGWEPLSVPVTFTTVGSTVSESSRGMAFALQSIQKRLPKIIGPIVAGYVLQEAESYSGSQEVGNFVGMRILVGASLVLGLVTLAIQFAWMPHHDVPPPGPSGREIVWQLHPTLRRLLLAEVFTRWCDWFVREFAILYLLFVRGVSPSMAGLLLGVQNFTALLTYLPVGRMTRTVGLQPFIGVTFIFFALFPLVLAVVPDRWLVVAFIVYGLREIGEPARKALITSLFPAEVRARGVGLYWGMRSFAICWASLVGAVLWYEFGPEWLLYSAFGLGCVGAAVFYGVCRMPEKSNADDADSHGSTNPR
jgi:predicted MFS family arabinose efflux permease